MTAQRLAFAAHVARGASVAFLILVAFVFALVGIIPRVLGFEPLTVLTGSMEPSIHAGDVVWVDPVPSSSSTVVPIGAIVVYRPDQDSDALITHRVIGRTTGTEGAYLIQGDANEDPDRPVLPEQIVGVATPPLVALGLPVSHAAPAVPVLGGFSDQVMARPVLPVLALIVIIIIPIVLSTLARRAAGGEGDSDPSKEVPA